MYQMGHRSINYNMPESIMVEKDIDKNRLEKTFRELIERHESLRTSFEVNNEKPVQKVHEPENVEFHIEFFDKTGVTAADSAGTDQVGPLIREFIRPFDLSKTPLFRARLIRTFEHDILLFDMHHIISDGVSRQVLGNEVEGVYRGDVLPGLKLHYKDYAQWQNSEEHQKRIREQKEYWLRRFTDEIPVLDLPYDFERPLIKTYEGSIFYFRIEKELCKELIHLIKESSTTLYIVLLAAYYVLLSRYSGCEDIVVGSPVTGRSHVDLYNIIGIFANMLSIRNKPQKNKSFRAFLEQVKTSVIDALENQDYQFDQLVSELGLQGTVDRNPVFDTVFAMQNIDNPLKMDAGENENTAGRNRWEDENHAYAPKIEISRFDLLFSAVEGKDEIFLWAEYSTSLFKESTIKIMCGHYIDILQEIAADINIKIKEIQLAHDFVSITSDSLEVDGEEFGF